MESLTVVSGGLATVFGDMQLFRCPVSSRLPKGCKEEKVSGGARPVVTQDREATASERVDSPPRRLQWRREAVPVLFPGATEPEIGVLQFRRAQTISQRDLCEMLPTSAKWPLLRESLRFRRGISAKWVQKQEQSKGNSRSKSRCQVKVAVQRAKGRKERANAAFLGVGVSTHMNARTMRGGVRVAATAWSGATSDDPTAWRHHTGQPKDGN
ncbi:hypothetical protein LXL04_008757 [Taraxacum kok-saghyz]